MALLKLRILLWVKHLVIDKRFQIAIIAMMVVVIDLFINSKLLLARACGVFGY